MYNQTLIALSLGVIGGYLDVALGLPLGAVKLVCLVGVARHIPRVVKEQTCLTLGAIEVHRWVPCLLHLLVQELNTFLWLCLLRRYLLILERDVAEERCIMVAICLKASRIEHRLIIIPT